MRREPASIRLTIALALGFAAPCVLASCTFGRGASASPAENGPAGYLASGATTTNDVALRDERPTALEALRSTKALLDSERDERQKVEKHLAEEKERNLTLRKDVDRLQAEAEAARKSLDESKTSLEELSRRLLQARLDRLKLEQELVRQQIAGLQKTPARDGNP